MVIPKYSVATTYTTERDRVEDSVTEEIDKVKQWRCVSPDVFNTREIYSISYILNNYLGVQRVLRNQNDS